MKEIRFKTELNTHEKLMEFSKKENVTISKLMNTIISCFFEYDVKFKQFLPKGVERKIEKRIRLTISEYELLNQFAIANNHKINDEIIYRLIGTFTKEPTITNTELSTMKALTNSLIRVGNNINQIARIMNEDNNKFNINDTLKNDILSLNILIKSHQKICQDFMIKASKRWHYKLEE